MKPREIACSAVMTALLIAAQYALGFVSGVELVTVLLLTFSRVFGVRCGVMTAVAFSLLRCLIYGFFPNVLLLYLVYYPAFAAISGITGKKPLPAVSCPIMLLCMAALSLWLAVSGLPVSAIYAPRVKALLWVIFGISLFLLAVYFLSKKDVREAASAASLAAVMTVLFTLLDDIITPLTMGYSPEAAAGYFYGGFLAMLPQTVFAALSVLLLYLPLKKAFTAALRYGGKNSTDGGSYEN